MPGESSSLNWKPASITMMSSPISMAVMFLPISSTPPSGMMRMLSPTLGKERVSVVLTTAALLSGWLKLRLESLNRGRTKRLLAGAGFLSPPSLVILTLGFALGALKLLMREFMLLISWGKKFPDFVGLYKPVADVGPTLALGNYPV